MINSQPHRALTAEAYEFLQICGMNKSEVIKEIISTTGRKYDNDISMVKIIVEGKLFLQGLKFDGPPQKCHVCGNKFQPVKTLNGKKGNFRAEINLETGMYEKQGYCGNHKQTEILEYYPSKATDKFIREMNLKISEREDSWQVRNLRQEVAASAEVKRKAKFTGLRDFKIKK